jgi:shikimate kinase
MKDRNLIITGFMGTGKSAVGRMVAERLGRKFVDSDELIEARAGKAIPEIFDREGEAHFRALEAEVCHELSDGRGWVVATGSHDRHRIWHLDPRFGKSFPQPQNSVGHLLYRQA